MEGAESDAAQPEIVTEQGALTPEHIHQYNELTSSGHLEEAASYLAGVLSLPDYKVEARSAIRLDYVAHTLSFAREAGYGPVSTASLMEVAQNLLEAAASGAGYAELEATFKTQLLQRTSPKPGPDSHQFSPNQVAAIARFFVKTFFQHWRLYAHCFQHQQDVSECSQGLQVEFMTVPSFEGAVPEAEWIAAQEGEAQARAAAAIKAEEDRLNAEAEAISAAAKAAEEEYERRRQEEASKKPATLEEAVEHMVALRLDEERRALAADYAVKEEALLKKLGELETRSQIAAA